MTHDSTKALRPEDSGSAPMPDSRDGRFGGSRQADPARVFICPECGSVATVMWAKRPICVHAWEGNAGTPEIWDGDNSDGEGRKIEESPHEPMRVPGPTTWAQMVPYSQAVEDARRRD